MLVLVFVLSCHKDQNKSFDHPPHPDSIGIGTEEYRQGERAAVNDIKKDDYRVYLFEIPLDSIRFEEMKNHFRQEYNIKLEYFDGSGSYKNGYNNKMKRIIRNKFGIDIKKEINKYYSQF